MPATTFAHLENRAVIALAGADKVEFLQGLVSNDITRAGPGVAVYAALLSPQGKFLHDMFVVEDADGRLLIECERDRLADLLRRLSMYKLRADVTLADESDTFDVYALLGGAAPTLDAGTLYDDPRLSDMGARAILPREGGKDILIGAGLTPSGHDDYDALRITLGLADGSRDMAIDKAILLENGFDELNGVDWNKGCYMGQELTARTKYRGLIKKRLVPVTIDGPAPEAGTPILMGEKEAGEMRSHAGDRGLALMRLEAMETGGPFVADKATLHPTKPDWADF